MQFSCPNCATRFKSATHRPGARVKCSKCGVLFVANPGNPITPKRTATPRPGLVTPRPQTTPSPSSAPISQTIPTQTAQDFQKPKSPIVPILIGGVAVLVLGLGSIMALFYVNSSKKDSKEVSVAPKVKPVVPTTEDTPPNVPIVTRVPEPVALDFVETRDPVTPKEDRTITESPETNTTEKSEVDEPEVVPPSPPPQEDEREVIPPEPSPQPEITPDVKEKEKNPDSTPQLVENPDKGPIISSPQPIISSPQPIISSPQPPMPPPMPIKRPESPDQGQNNRVEVTFLGSVAKGNRFAIIADRSGSMSSNLRFIDPQTNRPFSGRAIDFLHEELVRRTLWELSNQNAFFYVSFYGSKIEPMPYGDFWKGKKDFSALIPWIKSIQPKGSTRPLPAFQRVFQLNPRPDVIFFMTDGKIPNNTASQVALLNRQGKKVQINTIHFGNTVSFGSTGRYNRLVATYQFPEHIKKALLQGSRSSSGTNQLEQIARDSGGTFTRFGSGPNKGPVAGPGAALNPILGLTDHIINTDPVYFKRGTHFKLFKVDLKAGVPCQIDMVSSFDNYLYLLDPNGRILKSNDDGGEGLNALISFVPPVTGTYGIVATTYSKNRQGSFVLTVVTGGV